MADIVSGRVPARMATIQTRISGAGRNGGAIDGPRDASGAGREDALDGCGARDHSDGGSHADRRGHCGVVLCYLARVKRTHQCLDEVGARL